MKHSLKTILVAMLAFAVCICADARKKPLIGISTGYSQGGRASVSRAYSDAVMRAGGIPVLLPPVSSSSEAKEVLRRLDGIVFTGGADFSPELYGEEVLNESVSVEPWRDTLDVLYAEAALSIRMPILAICRGEQLMNIVLGGSLYQDLPSQILTDVSHRQKESSVYPSHKIVVDRSSRLYDIMGKDTLMVNSLHHQAVKKPSRKVKVVAVAEDGVIEAYEGTSRSQWLEAVQFHPEQLCREDDSWLAIFKALVKKAR